MDLRSMTFVMACNNMFGRKPNQTLQEFNAELKALMPEDREYLIREFRTVGIDATKSGVGA